jgi:hypothetical protein
VIGTSSVYNPAYYQVIKEMLLPLLLLLLMMI